MLGNFRQAAALSDPLEHSFPDPKSGWKCVDIEGFPGDRLLARLVAGVGGMYRPPCRIRETAVPEFLRPCLLRG